MGDGFLRWSHISIQVEVDDRKFIFQNLGTREIGFSVTQLTSEIILLFVIYKF
jgi:hypothetical protein